MPKKGEKLSEEQRATARENLRKAHEAKRLKQEAGHGPVKPVTDSAATAIAERPTPTEMQCVYCGVRFDAELLSEHQLRMHGNVVDPLSITGKAPEGKKPGEYYSPAKGVTLKVRHTWDYIKKNFPIQEGVSPITTNVIYQGVKVGFIAGMQQALPKPFWDKLYEHMEATRTAYSPDTPFGPIRTGMGAGENEVYRLPGAGLPRQGS